MVMTARRPGGWCGARVPIPRPPKGPRLSILVLDFPYLFKAARLRRRAAPVFDATSGSPRGSRLCPVGAAKTGGGDPIPRQIVSNCRPLMTGYVK